jgi:2,4-dienoyl-CoA reductase-like NADH-dependent reductase (Old Yellow Enzyme family)
LRFIPRDHIYGGKNMSKIFSPAPLGPLTLRNRLIHSATFECMATDDGLITEPLIKRYVNLARGEVGLIIPGYLYVDPSGKAIRGQAGISDDSHLPGLTRLVDAVHEAGGLIAFQIVHGGRQSPAKLIGRAPLAPSRFGRDPVSLNKPTAATESEIQHVIDSFKRAAERVRRSGADGLQLHCAHGYLLNEFLSPFFNRRRDRWGGSPENRFRLVREIITSIHEAVGEDMPLLIKINTNDHTPGQGIDPHLAAKYAGWLAEIGVTAVEISSGTYYTFHSVRGDVPIDELAKGLSWWMRPMAKRVFKRQIAPCSFKEFYHLPAAEIIKPSLGAVPLILVGGVRRLSEMERVLAEGKADFLSLSRPFIREPFLARRLKEGKATEAACISCNRCFAAVFNGMPVRCYANS